MILAELYRFEALGQRWTYTSADAPLEHDGDVYEPVPIGRSEAEQGQDINRSDLQIRVARDNDVGLVHLRYAPESITGVTVFQREEDGEVGVFWKGRVVSARASGSEITLVCEPVFTSMRQPGLRARYQKTCRHAVYARGCRLDPEDFALLALIEAVDGLVLTVPAAALQPNGWYLGGMVRTAGGSLRMITAHVGDQITVTRPITDLVEQLGNTGYGLGYGLDYGGPAVKLYPGCDRIRSTCHAKFDNVLNFGGFPWIPGASNNPFGGSSIL
ncbi:MAG TPA: phage BR0599 family protein [Rhodocyclaceae bacterium]|nr:phage BR0599 family protein [Rhodocyclaceae bacterium]